MDEFIDGELKRVYIPGTTKMAVFRMNRKVCIHEFRENMNRVEKISKQIKKEGFVTLLVDPSYMDCEIVDRDIPEIVMN